MLTLLAAEFFRKWPTTAELFQTMALTLLRDKQKRSNFVPRPAAFCLDCAVAHVPLWGVQL
jgi:hypothetical protein